MEIFSKHHYPFSVLGLSDKVNEISILSKKNYSTEILKKIFNSIDLTSLNSTDTPEKIKNICDKVNDFEKHYPSFPFVAGICVYPNLVSSVKKFISKSDIGIISVAGGFPSSQTFVEIKVAEAKLAFENGADEIEVVISLNGFLSGNYQMVYNEIASIKSSIGNAKLVVTIEIGALVDPLKIWEASVLSMHGGADFIKTSTGKFQTEISIETVIVILEAIKSYQKLNDRTIGLKLGNEIVSGAEAVIYYSAVENILENQTLDSEQFRIASNTLANNLIAETCQIETGLIQDVNYF